MRATALALLLLTLAGGVWILFDERAPEPSQGQARVAEPEPEPTPEPERQAERDAPAPKAAPIEDVTNDLPDVDDLPEPMAPFEGFPYECPLPPPMVFDGPDPNGWSRGPGPFPSRPVRR